MHLLLDLADRILVISRIWQFESGPPAVRAESDGFRQIAV